MKGLWGLLLLCCSVMDAVAQNVAIKTTGPFTPANVALLDLSGNTDKGLLVPRIALTATNAAAPVTTPVASGLLVYNTATSTLTGANAQFNVTPGFYIWDASQRWARYEALVRRPATYTTASSAAVTTSGSAWSVITGMQSVTMPLFQGDRVELKAYGTTTTAGAGDAEGMVEIAVDDGVGYVSLPNGSGSTVFSMDNGVQNFGGANNTTKYTPYHNWGMAGYYDVPADGTYTFAVRMRRLSGTVNITSGSSLRPNALQVEVIRP